MSREPHTLSHTKQTSSRGPLKSYNSLMEEKYLYPPSRAKVGCARVSVGSLCIDFYVPVYPIQEWGFKDWACEGWGLGQAYADSRPSLFYGDLGWRQWVNLMACFFAEFILGESCKFFKCCPTNEILKFFSLSAGQSRNAKEVEIYESSKVVCELSCGRELKF